MKNPILQATGRRGHDPVNRVLDTLILFTSSHSPACLADQIATRGIVGRAGSTSHGPVGQWILAQLGDLHTQGALAHVPASVSWRGWLAVYDPAGRLIGEVHIPTHHPLYQLDCQVNDLGRPCLVFQGKADPR